MTLTRRAVDNLLPLADMRSAFRDDALRMIGCLPGHPVTRAIRNGALRFDPPVWKDGHAALRFLASLLSDALTRVIADGKLPFEHLPSWDCTRPRPGPRLRDRSSPSLPPCRSAGVASGGQAVGTADHQRLRPLSRRRRPRDPDRTDPGIAAGAGFRPRRRRQRSPRGEGEAGSARQSKAHRPLDRMDGRIASQARRRYRGQIRGPRHSRTTARLSQASRTHRERLPARGLS